MKIGDYVAAIRRISLCPCRKTAGEKCGACTADQAVVDRAQRRR